MSANRMSANQEPALNNQVPRAPEVNARGSSQIDNEQFVSIYLELRRLAASSMSHERPAHTYQPTALVNELYLKFFQQQIATPVRQDELFGLAAHMMRQILVDYARKRSSVKRGSGAYKLALEDASPASQDNVAALVELDQALERLAESAPRQAKLVELKFFLGMSYAEVAQQLNIAVPTAKADWAYAKAFLRREMSRKPSGV